MAILSALSHLIYPSICCVCNDTLLKAETEICHSCWRALPRTNMPLADNLLSDKFLGRLRIVQAHAYLYMEKENSVEHLLYQIKYNNKKKLASYLAKQWSRELIDLGLKIDSIIPIPLSPKKAYMRGYNQAELLAIGLAEALQVPIYSPLYRIKNTESQTKKTRLERINNIEDSFAFNSKHQKQLYHPLIVDDVITTGATMEAYCTTLLQYYPESSISIASLAVKA